MGVPAVAAAVTSAYQAIPASAKDQAMGWLKKATKGTVATVTQAATYAKSNESQAVVVAEALVRHGAPVEVVEKMFTSSPNAEVIRTSLLALGAQLIAVGDDKRVGLSASSTDTASDVMRLELTRCLVRAFGSVSQAKKIQLALATLKTGDFDWYESVASSFGR